MELNRESLKNKVFFEKNNISIPTYNIYDLIKNTKSSPKWVHFGGGNIFRAFIAAAQDAAIEEGRSNTGIIVAETFDYEVVDRVFAKTDNLSMTAILNSKGDIDLNIIASITESLKTDEEGLKALKEIFSNRDLQMASFTITEKGYSLKSKGEYLPIIINDFTCGLSNVKHIMSIVTSLLYTRFKSCAKAMALVSMDNCSHNGDKLKSSIIDIAKNWLSNNLVEKEFIEYIENNISFPFTMIDKITPRPVEEISRNLAQMGFEGMEPIETSKNTFTARFVNAEVAEYLIIEDDFPNGRPDFGNKGVLFTTRSVVNNVETMKVTTCLNPLHTALAVYGVLLNHKTIAEEMEDMELKKLVKRIGYDEGLKVVIDPKIIKPKDFIDEVINERFANSFIKDRPERIATDTSQKVGIRFGNTIKAYVENENLKTEDLMGVPLALAGWLRYLVGIDDVGNKFTLSSDPVLDENGVFKDFANVKIGDHVEVKNILKREDIFSLDLTKIELGERIKFYFNEMLKEKGGVRKTLQKYL
ncbi:MAG: mannitol dehydrogenase family protein [Lachnospirales bacterium]